MPDNQQSQIRLRVDPVITTCPLCHTNIVTRVDHRSTIKTHLIACIICLIFWPCAWAPYCIDFCKDAYHYCPNCGAYLGTYDPLLCNS